MRKEDTKYASARNKIKTAKNILLVIHEKADIDAVASACALMDFLEKENQKYSAFCADPIPHQHFFLSHAEKIESNEKSLAFADFDLIIVLDCGSSNRTGISEKLKNRGKEQFLIEIDHHPKTEDYADLEIREDTYASTTELIYEFFKANKIKMDRNIAEAVLAGIITDTGSFLYPSTANRTVEISSECLSRGANLPRIMENVWKNKNLSALKAWGHAMTGLTINKKYNLAYTILSKEDLEGLSEDEIEGMSGFLSNLENVNGIVLLREQEDGMIKGSLRTASQKVDMGALARALGGGGHRKAAGFKIRGKLEKTEKGWMIT